MVLFRRFDVRGILIVYSDKEIVAFCWLIRGGE